MKNLILIVSVLLTFNLFSQKVYKSDSKYDADIKVFCVNSKYDADLLVFR
jgi:hypothetical protein